jgi:hypothetical protein
MTATVQIVNHGPGDLLVGTTRLGPEDAITVDVDTANPVTMVEPAAPIKALSSTTAEHEAQMAAAAGQP